MEFRPIFWCCGDVEMWLRFGAIELVNGVCVVVVTTLIPYCKALSSTLMVDILFHILHLRREFRTISIALS